MTKRTKPYRIDKDGNCQPWKDWWFSRVHFLKYMGHPLREARVIANAEAKEIGAYLVGLPKTKRK